MDDLITMNQAATLCRCSYPQMVRLVLVGEVEGWQDESRRWKVKRTSVERLVGRRLEAAKRRTVDAGTHTGLPTAKAKRARVNADAAA